MKRIEILLKGYLFGLKNWPGVTDNVIGHASFLFNGNPLTRIMVEAHRTDHPIKDVFIRLEKDINSNCRNKLIRNQIPLIEKKGGPTNKFFPKVLIISVTSRCNYTCADCFNNIFRKGEDLPSEVMDRILEEASEKGTKLVALSGGEPLTRKDLLDIIARHEDIYFQIFTNGSLIDQAIARRLAELGNAMPFISLEGGSFQTDERRGAGAYKKARNAMKYLKDEGVIFGINTMVTPHNFSYSTSDAFIEEIIQAGAMAIWYITYRPVGSNPDPFLVLNKHEHLALYKRVQRIRNNHPIVALENLFDPSNFGGCPARIGAGLHIDHLGNLTPCPPIHFANQNVLDQSLESAIEGSPLIKSIMISGQEGCIILEEPAKLLGMIDETNAFQTGEHDDRATLKSWKGRHTDTYIKEEKDVNDIYKLLMEAFQ